MGFVSITIDKYVVMHLENNSSEKEVDLRKRLKSALEAYNNGIKCSCGNDIWVIGSASVGNSCFTCITGESYPTEDYEIDSAIKKEKTKKVVGTLMTFPQLKSQAFSMMTDTRLIQT